MQYTWDPRKRKANLRDHEIDFVDAPQVFEGSTFTYEDTRFDYGEQRFVTLGLLDGIPVSIVHTESETSIRVISFRRATDHETEILFDQIKDQLPPPAVDEERRRPAQPSAPRDRPKERRKGHRSARPKGRPS